MTGIDPAFCGIFRWLVESTRRESPRIGLVYTKNYTRKRKSGNDRIGEYRKAVEDAGGRVAEIDQGEDPAITESVMESIDALLIPGGKDIDPVLFAEEPHPRVEHYDPGLDRLQLSLLAMAEKRGIPILGICRGIQIMNVHRGGDLYQDVPSQLGREVVHRVKRWELQGYE
jgi:gamma-glutamyl-gamma-aminobutyrate hydrolase PuuD